MEKKWANKETTETCTSRNLGGGRSNKSDENRLTYDETLVQAAKNVTKHNYLSQVQIHRQVC